MGTELSKVRTLTLAGMKAEGRRIVAVTAYDAITGAWAEAAGIDLVLVGDSLGNTALGYADTIAVTVRQMLHHCAAVARAVRHPLLVGDLPFLSYKVSPEQALRTAGRFLQEGGMEAVKLEGGAELAPTVGQLVRAGIPVMGHLGLLPQSVHALGGYRTQGDDESGAARMMKDARALEEAGAFCVVLEKVPAELAGQITAALKIPTIGIGAGPDCGGQVLVLSDVLGMTAEKPPRFVRAYAGLWEEAKSGLERYAEEIREGRFPKDEG